MPPERKAPPTTARGTNAPSQSPVAAASPRGAQALPPDLAQALLPLLGVLRTVRAVLLVFVVLHGVALFIFSQGSLAGLVFMMALWWGLGWLLQAAPKALGATSANVRAGTEPLQERLRQLAQQRKTGKTK